MAYWLSRFTETAQYGMVPQVAKDQYALNGAVSSWLDLSKNPPSEGTGMAVVWTPDFRYAWHNPPTVYVLGVTLDDQVYAETGRAVKIALELDWPASAWRKTGCPVGAAQDVIDLTTHTLAVGDTVGVEDSTATGLVDRPYWVVEVGSGRYIRVATTQGGQYIDITAAGTCTVYQTLTVRRAIRFFARHAPRHWRQPPIDNDGTITITVGGFVDEFDQDDDPAQCLDPPEAESYPPRDHG